ncbi:MAG: WD40 repeat domain-containing serine/threonine-protein kinase [Verrucomicrobiales bacterium]|nr:WD40 repeat domain-containing serine/threonine-protein kinase [Verrucomicrobiales bacterium]
MSATASPHVPGYEVFTPPVGEGSYGQVFLARNVAQGGWHAVKIVRRSHFESDRPYEREYRGISKFQPVSGAHESQLKILDVGRNDVDGFFFYVMELADNTDEREFDHSSYRPRTLEAVFRKQGRFCAEDCLRIGTALSTALAHLHRHGLVHRDIKPANIIYVGGLPKLADIGLVTESRMTVEPAGAEGYIAPEGQGTPLADIYSLGKVLYEISTGRDRMEFPALPSDFGQAPDHPQLLEYAAIWQKACDPDPKARHRSAAELSAELALLTAGESILGKRALELRLAWAKRAGFVAVLIVLLAAAALGTSRLREAARRREILVREAQMLRLGERQDGWSTNAWEKLTAASSINTDENLRNQAAATLVGLDFAIRNKIDGSGASALAFFPDGSRILLGDEQAKTLSVYDGASGKISVLGAMSPGPLGFRANGDPFQFCDIGEGHHVLHNPVTLKVLQQFSLPGTEQGKVAKVTALACGRDGMYCAAAIILTNGIGLTAIWEAQDGRFLGSLPNAAKVIAISDQSALLAAGNEDGTINVCSLPSLSGVAHMAQERMGIECLAFAQDVRVPFDNEPEPNASLLAAGDAGGSIFIYDVPRGRIKAMARGSHHQVLSLAFSPDRMTLASGGRKDLRIWDVASGHGLLICPNDWEYATSVAYYPDGQHLAVGIANPWGPGPSFRVVDVQDRRGIQALRGLTSQASLVRFSKSGQLLAALAHNWQVGIWNVSSNRLERMFDTPKGQYADNAAMAFGPDDTEFAFASGDYVCLWDLTTGRLLQKWKVPNGLVQVLAFRESGHLLFFQWEADPVTKRPVCRTRELAPNGFIEPLYELPEYDGRVIHAAASPDGQLIGVVGTSSQSPTTNHVVKVFDMFTGKEQYQLPCDTIGHKTSNQVVWDPSGRFVCYKWTKHSVWELVEVGNRSNSARFDRLIQAIHPTGHRFAAQPTTPASAKGCYYFSNDKSVATTLLGLDHAFASTLAEFSPDGHLLAWGTEDGTVLVCDLEKTRSELAKIGLGW